MTHENEVLYSNPYITVTYEPFREGHAYTVVTARSGNGGMVLAIIPASSENPDPRILLVSQLRPPMQAVAWELPAGAVDAGETLKAGSVREFREETGILVTEDDLIDLGMAHAAPSLLRDEVSLYAVMLAPDFDTKSVVVQADEIDDYRWVTIPEALELGLNDPDYSHFISLALMKAHNRKVISIKEYL
jgi:8-oxo-dGTP pyrophosphatase MutT (NUDIX family)